MVEGLKWQPGLLALLLTAFAHANDSPYLDALAGRQSIVRETRLSGRRCNCS
jgi:hypothetical protein